VHEDGVLSVPLLGSSGEFFRKSGRLEQSENTPFSDVWTKIVIRRLNEAILTLQEFV